MPILREDLLRLRKLRRLNNIILRRNYNMVARRKARRAVRRRVVKRAVKRRVKRAVRRRRR